MTTIKEDFIIQRRNRLKKDYLITSHVLLYCYKGLSDGAKQTYQVIDSMDWEDQETKDSKGYVFPAVETIAERRGKGISSIYRHIEELIEHKLLTRVRRKNMPSILIIEDVSAEEAKKYIESYVNRSNKVAVKLDNEARSKHADKEELQKEKSRILKNENSEKLDEFSKMRNAYKEEKDETKKNEINVNENLKIDGTKRGNGMTQLGVILKHFDTKKPSKILPPQKPKHKKRRPDNIEKRDYFAHQIAEELGDQKSLGAYRVMAEKIEGNVLLQLVAEVKETWKEGKVKESRGALYTSMVRQYCEKHNIELGFKRIM